MWNIWCSTIDSQKMQKSNFQRLLSFWWPWVFFREATFVPYLDHLIVEMEDRFFDQKQKCRSLWGLMPKYCDALPNAAQDLERLLEIYQEDIGTRAAVVPEVQRWVNKWKKEDVSTVPSSAIEALCACHADIYPNIANHFRHSSCINCYKWAQFQHHETS